MILGRLTAPGAFGDGEHGDGAAVEATAAFEKAAAEVVAKVGRVCVWMCLWGVLWG